MLIYKITNKKNGKIYIGVCKNFYVRVRTHLYHLRKNNHHSLKLQRSWNKYGEENFVFEIIERDVEENIIFQKEKEYIEFYNTFKCGFNCTIGGQGSLGRFGKKHQSSKFYYIYSLEGDYVTKRLTIKSVEKFTGKKIRMGNRNFCMSNSFIVTRKFTGKFFKDHFKLFKYDVNGTLISSYISTTYVEDYDKKNIYLSIRYKQPINGFLWVTTVTDQQKEQFNNLKVKIKMLEKDGNVVNNFDSITEAYDFLKIPVNGNITKCLKKKQNTAYGYMWEYQ